MFVDTLPDGELLLPVCIEANEIHHMLSALEMYRVMVNGGDNYPAFEAVLTAIDNMPNPQDAPCFDAGNASTGVCWTADTTNSAIKFSPNNPFTDTSQDRPTVGQWERWQDSINRPPKWVQDAIALAENLPFFDSNVGYFPNDCFAVAPDDNNNPMQFFQSLQSLLTLDFPFVEIEVSGTGELELHLLKIPFGGSAVIVWDIDFDIWDFLWDLVNGGSSPANNVIQTELEREITSIPPEANEENVIEIDFTEDIDHTVRVYFVPRIDYTALDFIGNGGGIREISMCQNLTLKSPSGDTITRQNHRIEKFTREGFIMSTIDDIRQGVHLGIYDVMRHAIAGHGNGVDSNTLSDVLIGAGGEVSVKNENSLPVPEFDTTSFEVRNGAVYNQASEFAKLFTTVNNQVTTNFSDNIILKSLQYAIFTPVIVAFNIANYKIATNPVVIDVPSLAKEIYCAGNFETGLFRYASNPLNHSEEELGHILDMATDVSKEALLEWYSAGRVEPLNLYASYPCYRQPAMSYVYDMSNPVTLSPKTWYTAQNTQRKYRVEIDVIAPFVDDTGRIFDGVYYVPASGIPDTWCKMRLQATSGNLQMSSVPSYLDGAGKYVLNYITGVNAITGTYFYALGTDRAWGTAVSGQLNIAIYDLGAV